MIKQRIVAVLFYPSLTRLWVRIAMNGSFQSRVSHHLNCAFCGIRLGCRQLLPRNSRGSEYGTAPRNMLLIGENFRLPVGVLFRNCLSLPEAASTSNVVLKSVMRLRYVVDRLLDIHVTTNFIQDTQKSALANRARVIALSAGGHRAGEWTTEVK